MSDTAEAYPWRSIRQEFGDLRINAPSEVRRTRLCALFSVLCCGPDAYHCAVRTSVSHAVRDEPELCPVFARDDASVCLIPIENQIPALPFLDYVFIHQDRLIGRTNLEASGTDRFPSRTRQTVLWGMDDITGTLILVIADVEFDRTTVAKIFSVGVIIYSDFL